MNNRTKACNIPQVVKQKVWERDNHRCVICGNPQAMPNAHFISRAQGGLGIEQNIVTLCITCHLLYDQSTMRKEYKERIQGYLQNHYKVWNEDMLVYKKGLTKGRKLL